MKRQSGFGDRKPQIWSGPYPCFDKDGKMKFVGLVFFFFLPSPVRVSQLTRWGLYNGRNVRFRRLQCFAKQHVFWQKLCNRKHERENCHLIFWPGFILPSAPSKGSALVYRWQVPYEHLCRSNGYHEVFVYVKRNCLSTGMFFGSSPADRRDLRGFAFLRWSVIFYQLREKSHWSQILNQRLTMSFFFPIASEIRMQFSWLFFQQALSRVG